MRTGFEFIVYRGCLEDGFSYKTPHGASLQLNSFVDNDEVLPFFLADEHEVGFVAGGVRLVGSDVSDSSVTFHGEHKGAVGVLMVERVQR